MKYNERSPAAAPPSVPHMVEQVLGCKWTLRVLGAIRAGVRRTGAVEKLQREIG